MNLRVLLVDDETIWLENLQTALETFPYVTVAGTASSGQAAVAFLQRHSVDVVFLDIEMSDIGGFDLAQHIQNTYPEVSLIFLTGHTDFALEGYRYAPVDFLIKPVNLLRLEKALARVLTLREKKTTSDVRIGLRIGSGLEIVHVGDVLYLEKVGRKVFLVDKKGEHLQMNDSLQKLQTIFEPYGFFRCHQSFLISLDKIKSVHLDGFKNSYLIEITDARQPVPLSREKYSELKTMLENREMPIF